MNIYVSCLLLVCVCNIDIYVGLKYKRVKNKEKTPGGKKSPELIPKLHMVSELSSMAMVVASSA